MAHVLTVGGVDITDDVEFTKSNFISLVNGQPGTCLITIRDPGRTFDFSIGDRILLAIDGLNVWAGYLLRLRRVYPFRAHSPSGIRLFELVGLDLNVLFTKRFVYKQSDPTEDKIIFAGGTNDTTALTELFANWINLSGDNLDLTSLVTSVGPMTPTDQTAAPIIPGQAWAVSMQMIGRMLAPVWYLNPDRKLVWGDVDVEDAPLDLSDDPGLGQVGYQSFSLLLDGTQLTNDVLYVGAGNGDSRIVYRRLQDTPSIMIHGRWQDGGLIQGIYKQKTIDETARSYVYGSPFNKRGRKDDKTVILCTVFTSGFRAGQKVRVISGPWGYDDVIPIRQMRVTWPVPFEPKYELMLSHELDSPYNLFDPYDYTADYPPVVTPIPVTPEIPKPPKPPDWRDYLGFFMESGQACDPIEPNFYDDLTNSFQHFIWYVPDQDGTQYNFETFNRADTDPATEGWGTSTDSHVWKNYRGMAYPGNYYHSAIVSNRGEETVWPPGRGISAEREGNITNLGGPWSTDESVLEFTFHSHYDDVENPLGRAYWLRYGLRDEYEGHWTGWEPWWVQITWNGTGEGTICDADGNCAPVNVGPPGTENTVTSEIELGDGGETGHRTCFNGTTCITGGTKKPPVDGEEQTTDSCCGEPVAALVYIDDFNRTVDAYAPPPPSGPGTGSWGTSDEGTTWVPYQSNYVPYHCWVEPEFGAALNFDEGGSAQIDLPMTPDLPIDYTFRDIFGSSTLDPFPANTLVFAFTGYGSGLQATVNLTGLLELSVGSGYDTYDLGVTFSDTSPVNVRVTSTDGRADAKLYAWQTGDPEPVDPQISLTNCGGTYTPTKIMVQGFPGGWDTQVGTWRIGAITAGSGGGAPGVDEQGPCFWIDDFADRTETGVWGTGDYGTWTSWANGGSIIGVEDGAAYVEIPGTVTVNYSGGGNLSGTPGPWNTQFFTWCGEFIVTANELNSYNITFGIHGHDGNFDRYIFEGSWLWDYTTAPETNVPFQIVGGQAYTWRWEYGLSINRLRVWQSGTPEPTLWTIDPGSVTEWPLVTLGTGSYPYMTISSIGAAANRAYRVDIPWVSFSRCTPSNQGADNAYGWVCEDFQGGTQAFYVSNPYTYTTVRVYINGMGETDFTEEGGNKVLLGYLTDSTDEIKICYLVAGTSGDGFIDSGPGGPYPV